MQTDNIPTDRGKFIVSCIVQSRSYAIYSSNYRLGNDGGVAAGWWDGVDVCPLTGGEARPGAGPGYNECWQTVRIHFHRGTRLQQPRHQSYQRTFAKLNSARRRGLLGPCTCCSVHNSATFPMLLLKSSIKVVILNEISSK